MVRVRSIGLPHAGHKFFVSTLIPTHVRILTFQHAFAVMTITIKGFRWKNQRTWVDRTPF